MAKKRGIQKGRFTNQPQINLKIISDLVYLYLQGLPDSTPCTSKGKQFNVSQPQSNPSSTYLNLSVSRRLVIKVLKLFVSDGVVEVSKFDDNMFRLQVDTHDSAGTRTIRDESAKSAASKIKLDGISNSLSNLNVRSVSTPDVNREPAARNRRETLTSRPCSRDKTERMADTEDFASLSRSHANSERRSKRIQDNIMKLKPRSFLSVPRSIRTPIHRGGTADIQFKLDSFSRYRKIDEVLSNTTMNTPRPMKISCILPKGRKSNDTEAEGIARQSFLRMNDFDSCSSKEDCRDAWDERVTPKGVVNWFNVRKPRRAATKFVWKKERFKDKGAEDKHERSEEGDDNGYTSDISADSEYSAKRPWKLRQPFLTCKAARNKPSLMKRKKSNSSVSSSVVRRWNMRSHPIRWIPSDDEGEERRRVEKRKTKCDNIDKHQSPQQTTATTVENKEREHKIKDTDKHVTFAPDTKRGSSDANPNGKPSSMNSLLCQVGSSLESTEGK